jgi:hypothetical protein
MFTKGNNSIVLKKSGEILINASLKKEPVFISPLNSPRIGLNSLIMPTININTTYINKFAQYNKININNLFYRETLDCKYYQFKLKDRLNYNIAFCKNIVNYGGNNKFEPVLLFNDLNSGKIFYTIPLLCIDRVPKTEFMNIFKIKKKEDFKDNTDLQKRLVENIIKMEKTEGIKIKQFHIRDDFFEKEIKDINFSKLFKDKDINIYTKP